MQYHVAKNGVRSGPFTQEEVYEGLTKGELRGSDLGWHEGLADWQPLLKLLPPPPVTGTVAMPVFGPAGGMPISAPTSNLAIASLVCGILGFFMMGLSSLPAVIMGHMAKAHIRRSMGKLEGRGLATAGLVMGYLGVALCAFMIFIIGFAVVARSTHPLAQSQNTLARAQVDSMSTALTTYKLVCMNYPTAEQGLQSLVERPRTGPTPLRWQRLLKVIPQDPWGHAYQYQIPAQRSGKDYDVFSLGPDGMAGTEDDVGNW